MDDYLFNFLADNLKNNEALIAFYSTFKGNQYIKDGRYEIRKEEILRLYEKYKSYPMSGEKIFKKIAKEVAYIMPNTTHMQVRQIIYEQLKTKKKSTS